MLISVFVVIVTVEAVNHAAWLADAIEQKRNADNLMISTTMTTPTITAMKEMARKSIRTTATRTRKHTSTNN